MNLKYMIMAGMFAFAGLCSCEMKDELWNKGEESEEMGLLDLGLDVNAVTNDVVTKVEGTTQIVNTEGYKIKITDSDGTIKKEFDYSGEQTTIELPVGNYSVNAHTPGEPTRTAPYYGGQIPINVKPGEDNLPVTVVCKMLNTKFQITYSEDLKEAFSSWTITFTDGTNNEVIERKTGEDANQPDAFYWMMNDNVKVIKMTFRGVNSEGNPVKMDQNITKPLGADSEFWCGGDALNINVQPGKEDPTNPSGVNSIVIDVNLKWNTDGKTDTVDVPVNNGEDSTEEPGTDPDPDPQPSEGPTLSGAYLNGTVNFDAAEGANNFPNVEIGMSTEKGIQSIKVRAQTSDETLGGILGSMGFTEGVNLVDTDNILLIQALGGEDKMPKAGDPSYTFSVNGIISQALSEVPGTHVFSFTVEDTEGNDASGNITFVITNSSTTK